MKILCFGDSLTYGYGVPEGAGWVETLQRRLPQITFINAGVNGDTLAQMGHRLDRLGDLTPYDYVFIMGGTNDFLMDSKVEMCYQKYRVLLETIQARGSRPIIGVPMEMAWEYGAGNAALHEYREKLLQLSRTLQCPLIDFLFLLQKETLCGKNVFDGDVHPNIRGYALMAEEAFRVISGLL